jgi:PKD repeat protein
MGDRVAIKYIKSNLVRPYHFILVLVVFFYILFSPSVALALVDVTLAWDASSGADGYRLFYREDGQDYHYSSPDWEGPGTTCTIYGLSDSTTYHFVVRAYNAYEESGDSNEAHLYPSGPNQPPTARFTASPASGDSPLTVSFNASGSSDPEGIIVSYNWDFDDGATGTGEITSHSFTSAGTYSVTLTVTDDDGATDSASTQIEVTTSPIPNQAPTARFTASPPSGDAPLVVSFNASGSSDPEGIIVSYNWDFDDGATGTGEITSHSFTSAGTYSVTLTVTDDGIPSEKDSTDMAITITYPAASNLPPDKPVIASPYYGQMECDPLLRVKTEPFSDPDGDTQSMSQWQIIKEADSSVVLEVNSGEHLTELPVPHTVLDRSTTYTVSVKFFDAYSEPSARSDPVVFTTTNSLVDYDGDGIPDDSEVDDTVDLNEDGVPDNDQPDVIKTAKSAAGGRKSVGVCKISTDVDGIVVLEPIHPSEILDKKNKPKKFFFGLAAYRLKLNQIGATTQVKVYYSEDISGANEYYLYDTVNGWQDYTEYTTFNPDGHSVTVELKDGGHGDSDGVANGVIVDPGGVADAASTGGLDSGAGGGCFIATAAFGSCVSPHVKVLRDFRDRYLLTNAPGECFVRLYYKYGPIGAGYIEKHNWLKPIVRVLLMPLVGISYILVRTSLATGILFGCLLFLSALSFYALYKGRRHKDTKDTNAQKLNSFNGIYRTRKTIVAESLQRSL